MKNYSSLGNKVVTKWFLKDPKHLPFLTETFEVVLLKRDDVFTTILSNFICAKLDAWHPKQIDLDMPKQKLAQLRFKVDEHKFAELVYQHRLLKDAYDLSCATYKIIYEEIRDDPVLKLNEIFGGDVSPDDIKLKLPTKWITNHETHVSNSAELRLICDEIMSYK